MVFRARASPRGSCENLLCAQVFLPAYGLGDNVVNTTVCRIEAGACDDRCFEGVCCGGQSGGRDGQKHKDVVNITRPSVRQGDAPERQHQEGSGSMCLSTLKNGKTEGREPPLVDEDWHAARQAISVDIGQFQLKKMYYKCKNMNKEVCSFTFLLDSKCQS